MRLLTAIDQLFILLEIAISRCTLVGCSCLRFPMALSDTFVSDLGSRWSRKDAAKFSV